jgi:hypothetical protein
MTLSGTRRPYKKCIGWSGMAAKKAPAGYKAALIIGG